MWQTWPTTAASERSVSRAMIGFVHSGKAHWFPLAPNRTFIVVVEYRRSAILFDPCMNCGRPPSWATLQTMVRDETVYFGARRTRRSRNDQLLPRSPSTPARVLRLDKNG